MLRVLDRCVLPSTWREREGEKREKKRENIYSDFQEVVSLRALLFASSEDCE